MDTLTSFSRSNRNLILTIDLVDALASTIKADGKMPQKTQQCVQRIKTRIRAIQEIIYGGAKLTLSKENYHKYNKIIKSLEKLILNISSDVVELDFFNAVLCLVEDARRSCKKSKNTRLQREWSFLNQSLSTLYGHVDPDLDQIEWMVLGENLAGRFGKIIVEK